MFISIFDGAFIESVEERFAGQFGIGHAGVSEKVTFRPERAVRISDQFISLPIQVIWGMLGMIIFSKVNILEKSTGDYFIFCESEKFLIRESWGQEDHLKKLYDQHVKVKVALNIPSFENQN